MNRRFFLLCVTMMSLCSLYSSAQITLESCYRKAQANYPAIKKFELIERTKEYNIRNVNRGYLPQATFSAKATYQSDVTQLPAAIGNIMGEAVDFSSGKDQYGATIDVTQTIWDGGVIRHKKDMAESEANSKTAENDVSLYAINRTVNEVYFGILLAEARIEQTDLYIAELERNISMIEGCISGGIAEQSDLDAIKVEWLQAKQTGVQWRTMREAYIKMLSHIIGKKLTEQTRFATPSITAYSTEIHRPELVMYDSHIASLQAKQKSLNSDIMPKFQLFVTGGYGRPALNMLNWDFKGYYIAGLRLSWNIGKLYTNKSDKRILDNSISQVKVERETFLYHTRMTIEQQDEHVRKYHEQLKYDDDIIALRTSIKEASAEKLRNGIMAGTEYMRDVTAEQSARQEKILHEIELLKTIYDLKYITNN